MNRIERYSDETQVMLAVLSGWQAGLFTSDIGIIDSYDPNAGTCTAILATQQKVRNAAGVETWVTLPKLVDVPVCFPGGGGFTLTFPVTKGDEAVIVFAQRCIDTWFQSGAAPGTDPGQVQADLRMHDISDGCAFVGIKSQPRRLSPAASTSGAQLRSDDGATVIEIGEGGVVKITAPGGTHFSGPVYMNGKRVDETHEHSGVQIGSSNSGGVV
jgi:hypothetical protein